VEQAFRPAESWSLKARALAPEEPMTIPHRGHTSESTYFITSNVSEKKSLLQTERSAGLLIEVMWHYREQGKYLLHEFVVMPDHFHLLLSPVGITLERGIQLIKGGYSFRAGKQFGWKEEIWQTSFHDRRVRDAAEYQKYREYIWQNPVRKGLAVTAENFPFCSASGKYELDDVPQRLKPQVKSATFPQA
jgi:putative transposase